MGPELRHLRYFVAVAEELSFTRAARRLHIAQPSLSTQIRDLEHLVGCQLLRRTTRQVEITLAGEALLAHARRVLAAAADLQADLGAIADGHKGTLRLGLFAFNAGELTAPILAAFRRRHPEIRLELVAMPWIDRYTDALLGGEADIAFGIPPYFDERLREIPLFTDRRVLAVPESHPLADAPEITVSDVIESDLSFLPPLSSAMTASSHVQRWSDVWDLTSERNGESAPRVPITLPAGLQEQLTCLVAYGAGLVPCDIAVRCIPVQGLTAVPITDLPRAPVSLIRPADTPSGIVDAFVATAREVTEQLVHLVPGARVVRSTKSTEVGSVQKLSPGTG